jgi:hypothetical protein
MIVLPEWRYNLLEKAGVDMSGFHKAPKMKEADKDRVVAYLNRDARRDAARRRRKSCSGSDSYGESPQHAPVCSFFAWFSMRLARWRRKNQLS